MDITSYALYDDAETDFYGGDNQPVVHPYDSVQTGIDGNYYVIDQVNGQYNIGFRADTIETIILDLSTGVTNISEYSDNYLKLVDTVGNIAALVGGLSIFNIRIKYVAVDSQRLSVSLGNGTAATYEMDCLLRADGDPDTGATVGYSVYGRSHSLNTITIPVLIAGGEGEEGVPWDPAIVGDLEVIYIGYWEGVPAATLGAIMITSIELNVGESSGDFWVNIAGMQEK